MESIKPKYKFLAPKLTYLSDVVVLAQAWKKSHNYIRRHNWYQNNLELDCSAVGVSSDLETLSKELRTAAYETASIRLVPAPKTGLWNFSNGWRSVDAAAGKAILRPLAHLGIREQTASTALMLCLADCIETAQGDTSLSSLSARRAQVYSYGNRLYCHWHEGRARFTWGNSDTYSRYYQDYRQFINRPIDIARSVTASQEETVVYIVKIDLSSFFDNIDIPTLVRTIRREYSSYRSQFRDAQPADAAFWKLAKSVLTFRWSAQDSELRSLLRDRRLPNGLPQGMVASGFFANAYLLAFDRHLGRAVRNRSFIGEGRQLQVHDYCRYVDDLRIVVSANADAVTEEQIAATVSNWVQRALTKSIGNATLNVNPDKTEVERYDSIGGNSGVVSRMNALQQKLSGPFDSTTLDSVEAGLQGLLSLAELGLQLSGTAEPNSQPTLSSLARPKLEIRDDTLTRFSAYRLFKTLSMRRAMTNANEVTEAGASSEILRHEFEVAARKLIAAWASNPSLVQVLNFGLDLFPSVTLLGPVIEALQGKLASGGSDYERYVAWYVLSEILRQAATQTGRRGEKDVRFKMGDLREYRSYLSKVAIEVLRDPRSPWYVQQQAILFLCVAGSDTQKAEIRTDGDEISLHLTLLDYLQGDYQESSVGDISILAVALVGYQIQQDTVKFVAWLKLYFANKVRSDIATAFEVIGQYDPELFEKITKSGRGRKAAEDGIVPRYLGEYIDGRWDGASDELPNESWLPLSKVVTHPSHALSQENGLLQLMRGLLELFCKRKIKPEKLTLLSVEVKSTDWSRINDPSSAHLEVRFRPGRLGADPRYATPSWFVSRYGWLYALGRIVRAAAIGEIDFTAHHWLRRTDIGWYSGIRSTWNKRQTGMSQAASALGGTTGGTTQWLSEFLLRALGWPGIMFESNLIPQMDDARGPRELLEIVEQRLAFQRRLYGASSDIPLYVHPVEWKVRSNGKLRVALVQGLVPQRSDFANGLSGLSDPNFRARHRNHLASLLHIASKKLLATDFVDGQEQKPRVDLVVISEYAVHVDDQDLLRQFSDSTGAMLFYGLMAASDPSTGKFVNAARWLVPQRRSDKRTWVEVDQGKGNLTSEEVTLGVQSWRPYQVVIELQFGEGRSYRLAGAVCYDATDISLAADLRNISHAFVVAALNPDVNTFDSMAVALRYHMYQHVLIANTGEFGGSTAQAPYTKEYRRLLAHSHGGNQLAICVFEIDVDDFGPKMRAKNLDALEPKRTIGKTPPANLQRW